MVGDDLHGLDVTTEDVLAACPQVAAGIEVLDSTPQVALRPRWLLDYLRTGQLPDLTTPNLSGGPGLPGPTIFGAYGEWMGTL